VTLILRPSGRGNWSAVTVHLTGRRADPLLVQRGQLFALGGITWRVVRVMP
jgi:hypothetical protein